MINGNACFAYFNKNWGIPSHWTFLVRLPSITSNEPVGAVAYSEDRETGTDEWSRHSADMATRCSTGAASTSSFAVLTEYLIQ